jgi:hypothetical protein
MCSIIQFVLSQIKVYTDHVQTRIYPTKYQAPPNYILFFADFLYSVSRASTRLIQKMSYTYTTTGPSDRQTYSNEIKWNTIEPS